MSWLNVLDPNNSGRICLTLLHSLWQVALAALVAGIVSRLWRKSSVEWSYFIHLSALLVGLAALPVTFSLLSPGAPSARQPDALPAIAEVASADASSKANSPSVLSAPRERTQLANKSNEVAPVSHQDSSTTTQISWQWSHITNWLAGIYATGVAAMLLRLVVSVIRTERLRRFAVTIQDGPAVAAVNRLVRRWHLRSAPALARAEQIVVPTVIGFVKPMILLPASALSGLTANELELILAHELAHVRRLDMWANLLQRLAEAILFFNPALWYLSRRISALREYCCDELACCDQTARSAATRAAYATALVRVVELAHPLAARNPSLAGLAASGNSPSELRRRVARLVGEPLSEPLRISRGGLLTTIAFTIAVVAGPAWLRSETQTPTAAQFPPPLTEADHVVSAARARTFGLQKVPRISIRQAFWSADVPSMTKVKESSLKKLWQARNQPSDAAMRRNGDMTVTSAWDGAKLLIQMDSKQVIDPAAPAQTWTQSLYWDGAEGWLGETSPPTRNVYRYSSMDKLFELAAMYSFPQWTAAGGRLPWGGPSVVVEQYGFDPQFTRYQHAGTETIDGGECDIYDGPGRHERIWIEKPTGVVKAVSRYFVHDSLPNYYTELIRDVAGRTFASASEYQQWIKDQPKEMQEKLSAHWAAAHWKLAEPGNLTVFSDYRKIAPGVSWPMKSECLTVHPAGQSAKAGYKYFRSETNVTEVSQDFSIREVAKFALPEKGMTVTDRRFDPRIEVKYAWKDSLSEKEIQDLYQAKLVERHQAKEVERKVNETPINSIDDAIHILTEGPKTDPTKVWARAIKYLVDHKTESLPVLIKQLDSENRDHPLTKIAFALRAIGDQRAVPALIRALPRTLLPSRGDYGLTLDDPELCAFMQKNDQKGTVRDGSNYFDYGRAFREVVSALHRLTGQNMGEMELQWISLAESPAQQDLQRAQFHQLAERWADWWEANWKLMVRHAAYAKVDLPPLSPATKPLAGRKSPPAGPGVKLQGGMQGWIIQSVQDSKRRCFIDLDTMREGDWPSSLPPVEKIGVDSPELLAWARKQGYDVMGITYTSPETGKPTYCLKSIGMHTWKISPDEHRKLPDAMAGSIAYPLSHPVDLLIQQHEMKPPYDRKFGGDAFLFITSEGAAGLLRMTAQVTNTDNPGAGAYSGEEEFNSSGYYRGAKITFSTMTEADAPPK